MRGPQHPAALLPLIDMANHSFAPNCEVRPGRRAGAAPFPGTLRFRKSGVSLLCCACRSALRPPWSAVSVPGHAHG